MVQKLLPTVISFVAEMNMDNRIALGFERFLNQFHIGLLRRSPAFSDVALCTGANYIFPSALTAETSGNDMVKRQFRGREFFPAVLTAVSVSGKKIAAVEFDGLTRQAVIEKKADNSGYSQFEIDGGNPVLILGFEKMLHLADLLPSLEVVVGIVSIIAGNNLGQIPTKQRKSPPGTDDSQSHIVLIEY